MEKNSITAKFHLPGLFEFYDFYKEFLPLFFEHREYFHEWVEIASIYGALGDCIWGGGRVGFGDCEPDAVLNLCEQYHISARLTFSNSLLKEEHLSDKKCNKLCRMFEASGSGRGSECEPPVRNGVIVHSDLLLNYLKDKYPGLYFVSSTTKVLTDFSEFRAEINRPSFSYVVPDFRLNKRFDDLKLLSSFEKEKVEFLINECCFVGCTDRKACYENVSRKCLGEDCPDHICRAPDAASGYLFSKAMENPSFISVSDIQNVYLSLGFSNFKIEGRGLGNAVLLEFLLYYLTKPEYHLRVRESLYLDSCLNLF